MKVFIKKVSLFSIFLFIVNLMCFPDIVKSDVSNFSYGDKELQRSIDFNNVNIKKVIENNDTINIKVEKLWDGDAEYNRPKNITIKLFCDGKDTGKNLNLTSENDWTGEFEGLFPRFYNGPNGEKLEHNYTIKELALDNYDPSYTYSYQDNSIDTSKLQLWVPATEIKQDEDYIVVDGNSEGKHNLYRAEAYQTNKVIMGQVNIINKTIKDEEGINYNNYIIINDQDDSSDYLTWKAKKVNNDSNKFYLYSNALKLWNGSIGALKYRDDNITVPKGEANSIDQEFYGTKDINSINNAYKTETSNKNIYLYKKVNLSKNEFSNGELNARIINRYNPPIASPDESKNETFDLDINKKWVNDSKNDRPKSLNFKLLANGEETGKSLTITESENWKGSFKNLPKYDKNNKEILYSVKEEIPFGYTVKYDYNMDTKEKSYWVPTNSFVDGETYIIVTKAITGNVIGMEAKNNKKFAWTKENNANTINVSSGPITVNGNTYDRYITDEEAMKHTAMQWIANSVGLQHGNQVGDRNAFTLKNVMNGLYAKDTGQGDLVSKPGKESYWYYGYTRLDASGKPAKRKPSNPEDEWSNLLGSMNDYFLLSNNHTGDANAVEAQTFYLYKKVTTKNPSIDVINTKSETKSVKVYKSWNDKGNEDYRPDNISVGLFINGEFSNRKIILNSTNEWYGEFNNLLKYDGDGKEINYTVKELDKLENYDVKYSYGINSDGDSVINIVNTLIKKNVSLKINKIDSESKMPLEGAEFKLIDAKSNEELSFIFDKNNKVFILDKSNNGNTILSPIKGENSFLIKDLSYGDYILTEVKSPEGYLKDKDIYIHLSEKSSYYSLGKDGEKIKLNLDNQIFTISVENTKGIIIPDTGGNGFYLPKKYLFIILSISIILIINFLLINTRRKKNG